MILVVDNFDSFTYNIVAFYEKIGEDVVVKRNNEITISEIEKLNPSHIVLSPGPKTPSDAPLILDILDKFKGKKKILGICLGHQAIGEYFGGKIIKAKEVCHGKVHPITHDGKGVFDSLPPTVYQTRYHSLVIDRKSIPSELIVTAKTADGEIMGVRHQKYEIEGVQFHPESIKSDGGEKILANFIRKDSKAKKTEEEMDYTSLLKKIVARKDLSSEESYTFMKNVSRGVVPKEIISSLLLGLSMKGESSLEIAGFARFLVENATPFSAVDNNIDIVGTGGDGSNTFNISTTSSIVVASCAVPVSKHGNRAVSSKCGSADLLKELGIDIEVTPEIMEKSLRDANIAFLFAPVYHKSMKEVAGVRQTLKIKTLFNILGPLVNPAKPKSIMLGVYDKSLMHLIADTLMELDYKRAVVVHSKDGLDEASIYEKTYVVEINNKEKKSYEIDPKDYGLEGVSIENIVGGDIKENAKITLDILSGENRGEARKIVLLNSAIALYVSGKTKSIEEGVKMAASSIDSGKSMETLKAFQRAVQKR